MSEVVLGQEIEDGFAQQPELAAAVTPNVLTAVKSVPHRGPLEMMADVPVTLVFEVARVEISIRQLLELKQGSLMALPAADLDSIKIMVDGTPIALGDITIDQRCYGVRVDELLPLEGDDSAGERA